MPKSFKKEMLRKMLHMMGIPPLVAYMLVRYYWDERVAVMAMTGLFLVLMEIEYVRLEIKPKLPIPKSFDVLRPRERDNVASMIFFVAAMIIAFSAFDFAIALTALLLTIFGDLVAAIVGIKFGKRKIYKSKSLEGFIAGLIMNLIVGFLMMPDYPFIYIMMAFTASIVELLTTKLDDNLTVPLFAGFIGQVVAYNANIHIAAFPWPFDWILTLIK